MWASSHTPLTICYKSSLGELFKFIFLAALAFRSVDLTWFSIRPLATEASGSDCPSVEKLRQSREAFQKALALNPANADAHNALGLVLMELNEYDHAVGEFRRSLELQPHSLKFANDLALALTKAGEIDQALALYKNLLKSNPDSPELHSNYGLGALAEILRRTLA